MKDLDFKFAWTAALTVITAILLMVSIQQGGEIAAIKAEKSAFVEKTEKTLMDYAQALRRNFEKAESNLERIAELEKQNMILLKDQRKYELVFDKAGIEIWAPAGTRIAEKSDGVKVTLPKGDLMWSTIIVLLRDKREWTRTESSYGYVSYDFHTAMCWEIHTIATLGDEKWTIGFK